MIQIEIPFDIPDIHVERVDSTEQGAVIITVTSTVEGTTCRKCGRRITTFHGHDRNILLRHLPILGRHTFLCLRPRRYQCRQCKRRPTTTQTLSWYTPRSPLTTAYEDHLLKGLVNSTVEDVSQREEVGYDTIMGVLNRRIRGEVDWQRLETLKELGLDEISLRKGHTHFVTIVTSRTEETTTILAVLKDRKKSTVRRFLTRIPLRLRRQITVLCSDMYEGFVNAAKEVLGRCVIVIDRFHVAKLYRGVLDTVRKQEMTHLKKTLSKTAYKTLKGVLWALRKSPDTLTKKERGLLKRVFALSPVLEQVYVCTQELTAIFEAPLSKREAIEHITRWKLRVKHLGVPCFRTFLRTLDTYLHEITNYFLARRTSGFVEGFNNKLKVIKRRCYGIVNVTHF